MNARLTLPLWGVLLLTATLFGSSLLFIKIAVEGIPPFSLSAGRAFLAAAAILLVMRLNNVRFPPFGKAWIPILVLGVMTAAVPYVAIAWGQVYIDSSLGGILFATIPLFSILVAPVFLADEHLTGNRLVGALIGFGGVILAIGPEALTGLGTQMLGAGVTLLAALSYAVGNIYTRMQGHLSPMVLAGGQLLVATVILIPISLYVDSPWTLSPTPAHLASLAVTAIVSTAIPVLLIFWLIRNAGASNASLLAFFMPVVAVLLGVLILDEAVSTSAIGGFALIILGAALVNGNLRIWPRPATGGA